MKRTASQLRRSARLSLDIRSFLVNLVSAARIYGEKNVFSSKARHSSGQECEMEGPSKASHLTRLAMSSRTAPHACTACTC